MLAVVLVTGEAGGLTLVIVVFFVVVGWTTAFVGSGLLVELIFVLIRAQLRKLGLSYAVDRRLIGLVVLAEVLLENYGLRFSGFEGVGE